MRVLLLYLFMFAFVPCYAQTYEQYMSSRLKVRGLDSVIVYCTFFYDFRFPSVKIKITPTKYCMKMRAISPECSDDDDEYTMPFKVRPIIEKYIILSIDSFFISNTARKYVLKKKKEGGFFSELPPIWIDRYYKKKGRVTTSIESEGVYANRPLHIGDHLIKLSENFKLLIRTLNHHMIKNLHDEKIENEYYEWLKNEKREGLSTSVYE